MVLLSVYLVYWGCLCRVLGVKSTNKLRICNIRNIVV
nr:MAG TPA: hypothetical protein [Caudoviricetes sp.]